MPILLLFLGLFLYIGWYISSVLGLIGFLAVTAVGYLGCTKLLKTASDSGEIEEDSFEDKIRWYVPLVFGLLVLLTTPIWDSDGYCDHQTEAEIVPGTPTLRDVFEGNTPTNTFIRDVSRDCKKEGAWEFIGGWDYDDNWRVGFVYILSGIAGLILIVPLGFFVFAFVVTRGENQEDVWQPVEAKKKKVTPGIGKPGREVVGSAQSDMFLFCLKNVEDIISKNHLSKGDYTTWFGRCADNYIESYARHSKKHKKDEVIDRLQWAIDLIPEVYSGKSIETGKKREAYLNERIETIKGL